MKRGFFGIAMYHPKTSHNWGTLLRTALLMEADFVACVGSRFTPQASDTLKSHRHMPVFRYQSFEDFKASMPYDCKLIGVEMTEDAFTLKNFKHPERAIYLLGAEDHGLPERVIEECHGIIKLAGEFSMNVAVAGSIVIYHRQAL